MTITFVAALLTAEALAAPPVREMSIAGANDAGFVLFPSVLPDGGVSHSLRLTFASTGISTLDALSVINNSGAVFEVQGVTPVTLGGSGTSDITVSFTPRGQVGMFQGRLVIDFDGSLRDDSVVLCGASSELADGGLAPACAMPTRAPTRFIPSSSGNPNGGCSSSAGAGVALVALAAWFKRRSSRVPARSDRSPR